MCIEELYYKYIDPITTPINNQFNIIIKLFRNGILSYNIHKGKVQIGGNRSAQSIFNIIIENIST